MCGLLLGGGVVYGLVHERVTPISAIVIPHHDMVRDAREDFLVSIHDEVNPETLIILAPDHFDAARAPIVTTDRVWQTSVGDVLPNEALVRGSGAVLHDEPFVHEHGVTSIIAPLHRAFPHAAVVPILVSRRATYADMEKLVETLTHACEDRCLLVASIDFSHTTHRGVATLHDVLSLRVLTELDSVRAYQKAEVDSPEALTALVLWAEANDTRRFDLFAHTHSGMLTDVEVGEMTTHIMGAYRNGERVSQPNYTFMIGGDTMFARSIGKMRDPFGSLGERFFWGVDDALVNLEGVFVPPESGIARLDEETTFPPQFRFLSSHHISLLRARVSGVFHTNNHVHDGGYDGYAYTHALLAEAGMDVIAPHAPTSTEVGVYIPRESSVPVAYVSFSAVGRAPEFASRVRELSRTHVVIAHVHFGREYERVHSAAQEDIAHTLIDNGADLVIGCHPHVVQDVELYKGVPIFYSLGNFLFDQKDEQGTDTGLVLGGVVTPDGMMLYPVPVRAYLTPKPLTTDEAGDTFSSVREVLGSYRVDADSYYIPRVVH